MTKLHHFWQTLRQTCFFDIDLIVIIKCLYSDLRNNRVAHPPWFVLTSFLNVNFSKGVFCLSPCLLPSNINMHCKH